MARHTTSIVIVSDGRRDALLKTIESLDWLEATDFEVVVVCGPTPDGSREAVAAFADRIKICHCPVRNISIARNVGIAAAAGDIIAFLDDDAIPEPEWLDQLIAPYADPAVGAVGGVVYDHTGVVVQYDFAAADRLGHADRSWTRAADELNFPLSAQFPHMLGANSSVRRKAIVDIGGFDEEYEFYLDETDLCCRLIDNGWLIRQLPNAFVHHKFLPSAIRSPNRVTRKRYSVLKNKVYYSLMNNKCHFSFQEILTDAQSFINEHARDMQWQVEHGNLQPDDLAQFQVDAERALEVGLKRGLSGERLLPAAGFFADPEPFNPWPRRFEFGPAGRGVYCFVSQEYPTGSIGGIGKHIFDLATTIGQRGHQVHVITKDGSHDRIDFEHGVWVHRLVPPSSTPEPIPPGWTVPPHIWAHSVNVMNEVRRITAKRAVHAVHAPIWDCEAVAIAARGEVPLVIGLHTTLHQWLDSKEDKRRDVGFMKEFGRPMLATETRLLEAADAIHGNSAAIVEEIRRRHGVALAPPRLRIVPHGLVDEREAPREPPPTLPRGAVRLLFVGRLEERKGIQVLLPVAKRLLATRPWLRVDVVGDDGLPSPGGRRYREMFEEKPRSGVCGPPRLVFHGEVSGEQLRGFYAASDAVVVPSLFESFGLVLVEAMMHGKATVASRAGGMVEVGVEGETTLFCEPGDEASLEAALAAVIDDAALRARLGEGGRRRFETHFMPGRMADGVLDILAAAASRWSRARQERAS